MRSINFVIICFLLNNFFIVYASDLEVFMDEKSVQVNTQTFEIDSSTENRKKTVLDIKYQKIKNESDELTQPIEISYTNAMKDTVRFCMPIILSAIPSMINGIWISHLYGELGGDALSAEMITMVWKDLILKTAAKGLKSTLIIAGQLNGKGNDDLERSITIGNVNKSAVILTILYSALTLPLLLEVGNITGIIGIADNSGVLQQVQSYFNGFIWGLPATLFLNNDELFSIAIGDNYIPLLYGCLQAGSSSLLAYPFALGKWGFPKLGAEGIGYAMSAGAWIAWVALRTHYICNKKYSSYKLLNFQSIHWENLKNYMSYAIPLAASNSVTLIQSFFYTQFIIGAGSNVAQAYSSSAALFRQLNIALLSYSSSVNALIANNVPQRIVISTHLLTEASENPMLQLSSEQDDLSRFFSNNSNASNASDDSSAQVIVGNQLTQQIEFRNCKRLVESSIILSLGFVTLTSIPVLIYRNSLISFFGGDKLSKTTTQLAQLYFLYNFGSTIFNGYTAPFEASFFGLGDIKGPVLINLGIDFTTILIAALASYHGNDPNVIVAANIIGHAIGAIAYSSRWWQFIRNR